MVQISMDQTLQFDLAHDCYFPLLWDYDHVTFILFLFESMTYVGYMWSKMKIFFVLIYVLCITDTVIW